MVSRLLRLLRTGWIKRLIERWIIPAADVMLAPLVFLAACLLKLVRRVGVYRMTLSRAILRQVGVFPIRDHYYEPLFHPRHLRRALDEERRLPGIDFDVPGQLELLAQFDYASEIAALPRTPTPGRFHFGNPNFGAGDAEFFYSAIRHFRPARILEIGSGFSTLLALEAVRRNQAEDAGYRCAITCVEPYEMAWLDSTAGIEVLRQTVETLDERRVTALAANDILFIDSSHVIRPQGDVVHEYLELLPLLAPGVLIHIHDISTPRDYPAAWVTEEVRLYSEQYMVEALLTGGSRFGVLAALNLLAYRHPEQLAAKFPVFAARRNPQEPSSLWLIRR